MQYKNTIVLLISKQKNMKTERKALFITIFMIITPTIGYFIFGKNAVAYCISTYVLIFLSMLLYSLLCMLLNK